MKQTSAGILLVRAALGGTPGAEFLLAHPGGPYFSKKDAGSWTIPKGQVEPGEALQDAALREFHEETGGGVALGPLEAIGEIKLKSGKRVHGWAALGDCDPSQLRSNSFETEWPPRSGKLQSFPELDRFAWYDLGAATQAIHPAQLPFLERARRVLGLAVSL